MINVDMFLAYVQLEGIGVRVGLLIQADHVVIVLHDPLHVAWLGLAVLGIVDHLPGALL